MTEIATEVVAGPGALAELESEIRRIVREEIAAENKRRSDRLQGFSPSTIRVGEVIANIERLMRRPKPI